MTFSYFIDTEYSSTAIDGLVLSPLARRIQIGWKSGSVSSHSVRLRDQVRLFIRYAMIDESLSFGEWVNQMMDQETL